MKRQRQNQAENGVSHQATYRQWKRKMYSEIRRRIFCYVNGKEQMEEKRKECTASEPKKEHRKRNAEYTRKKNLGKRANKRARKAKARALQSGDANDTEATLGKPAEADAEIESTEEEQEALKGEPELGKGGVTTARPLTPDLKHSP
jgi:hypothetical protein